MNTDEDYAHDEYLDMLYHEFGPQWAEDHGLSVYDDVVKEFTAERLRSYYVGNPDVARPARHAVAYAQSLMPSHPKAALVFAVTATELAVKTVLLKPLVSGLVHTEAVASLVTDLTVQQTGWDRLQPLIEILAKVGGVDLRTYKRSRSKKILWQEISEIQAARNRVIHKGADVDQSLAELGLAVSSALLDELFPSVLAKFELHLHPPGVICDEKHTVNLRVTFTISGQPPTYVQAHVEVNTPRLDRLDSPQAIAGQLTTFVEESDLKMLRSAPSCVYMYITSLLVRYEVQFDNDSATFKGAKVPFD